MSYTDCYVEPGDLASNDVIERLHGNFRAIKNELDVSRALSEERGEALIVKDHELMILRELAELGSGAMVAELRTENERLLEANRLLCLKACDWPGGRPDIEAFVAEIEAALSLAKQQLAYLLDEHTKLVAGGMYAGVAAVAAGGRVNREQRPAGAEGPSAIAIRRMFSDMEDWRDGPTTEPTSTTAGSRPDSAGPSGVAGSAPRNRIDPFDCGRDHGIVDRHNRR